MRNFITLALLACVAVVNGQEKKEASTGKDKKDYSTGDTRPNPIDFEPDMSEFPDEWTNPCGKDEKCRASPPNPSWSKIAEYNQDFYSYWYECMANPQQCKMVRGYCRMQTNRAYPTTYPHGQVHLIEFHFSGGVSSPVFLWTYMTQMPYPSSRYGYSINERKWDYKDCCSAGRHLQSPGQTHGWNNSSNPPYNHHIGNLYPLTSDAGGNVWWNFQYANRPSFTGTYNIIGKTMVVYERPDDFGMDAWGAPAPGTPYSWDTEEYGSTGQRIACCEIRRFWIDWQQQRDDFRGRGLSAELGDEVDVFTVDEFRELFGTEPERLPGEPGFFDQN